MKNEIKLMDKSIWKIQHKQWVEAIEIRVRENPKWIDELVRTIQIHWLNKTIPTKFNIDRKWEKQYKNQAELAPDVAYQYLRVILIGMAFKALGSDCKVVALK
jgi:hypothetical protein